MSAAAAAAAARKRHWSQSEATPRWFGFDTKTCGIMPFTANVHEDEVIAFAAYDLESGDAYTALINPALHNPRYKYRAGVCTCVTNYMQLLMPRPILAVSLLAGAACRCYYHISTE
jgi:hypothetical protein